MIKHPQYHQQEQRKQRKKQQTKNATVVHVVLLLSSCIVFGIVTTYWQHSSVVSTQEQQQEYHDHDGIMRHQLQNDIPQKQQKQQQQQKQQEQQQQQQQKQQQQQQQQQDEHSMMLFHLVHTTNETSFRPDNIRAIESIFYHHPTAKVTLYVKNMTHRPIQHLIVAGYDLQIQNLNITTLLYDAMTIPYSTIKKERVTKFMNLIHWYPTTKFWYTNESNLFRLLILYIKGGIYLDTDLIVTRSLSNLQNVIGVQSYNEENEDDKTTVVVDPTSPSLQMSFNGAVMIFDQYNKFLSHCINELLRDFRPRIWGHNGPKLLNRIILVQKRQDYQCAITEFLTKEEQQRRQQQQHQQQQQQQQESKIEQSTHQVATVKAYGSNSSSVTQDAFTTRTTSSRRTSTVMTIVNNNETSSSSSNNKKRHDSSCPLSLLPASAFYPIPMFYIGQWCFQSNITEPYVQELKHAMTMSLSSPEEEAKEEDETNSSSSSLSSPMMVSSSSSSSSSIIFPTYVVHLNNKITSKYWEDYHGKTQPNTLCHWLYHSFCVECDVVQI